MNKAIMPPVFSPAPGSGGSRLIHSHVASAGYDQLTNLASIREFQF